MGIPRAVLTRPVAAAADAGPAMTPTDAGTGGEVKQAPADGATEYPVGTETLPDDTGSNTSTETVAAAGKEEIRSVIAGRKGLHDLTLELRKLG